MALSFRHHTLLGMGARLLLTLAPWPARAVDEIQVYNANIADVGQWTFDQHLNYTWQGRTRPEFPGGLIPKHSLNGTPEPAYGVTDGWELGFYAPFAVTSDGQFLSNGAKIRNLFVVPHAAERKFFYGVNFEFSYQTPPFSLSRYALEIRPIVGVRNSDWEVIVNPIVDLSFGTAGQADFAPAARVARNLGQDRFVGLEYYADFGEIGNFPSLREQQHQLYAVTDFKLGKFDIELGVGYGLTPGSDRLITKAIIGYAFPILGKNTDTDESTPKTPLATQPTGRRSAGRTSNFEPFEMR
jgi:hypothetical protein